MWACSSSCPAKFQHYSAECLGCMHPAWHTHGKGLFAGELQSFPGFWGQRKDRCYLCTPALCCLFLLVPVLLAAETQQLVLMRCSALAAPCLRDTWLPGGRDGMSPAAWGPFGGALGNLAQLWGAAPQSHPSIRAAWLSDCGPARRRGPCLRHCTPFKAALWVSFLFSLFPPSLSSPPPSGSQGWGFSFWLHPEIPEGFRSPRGLSMS